MPESKSYSFRRRRVRFFAGLGEIRVLRLRIFLTVHVYYPTPRWYKHLACETMILSPDPIHYFSLQPLLQTHNNALQHRAIKQLAQFLLCPIHKFL